ncbi:hypothetical protein DFH94DRAFT_338320 [Russula ochroleuca]|jgi:hypothetical protein|uniref:BTB domain-containing protein n=1 Tax=Russula ochroleuca TaxID=152965 RepID=A0A9P5TBW2_9AGAM|nr:hypothetical protein DFH94DRAFT_338320 [Russula ochroleuca]
MSSSDEVFEILDDPDADIILCSRDHHKFRVLKLYVTKVSPVLRDLIQTASTSHAANPTSPLPSVQLSDSGVILSSLLTLILPMFPVLPSTLEHTIILLSAAQNYQMDSILSRIREMIALQDPPLIRRETAFQAYSLAKMHGLRQEALQAARNTWTFTFTIEDLEDELESIHGIYFHELWKYYQSVQIHLRSDLEAFRATGMPSLTCPPCGSNTIHGTPVWLDGYVASIVKSPALFDLTEFHMCFSRHIMENRCSCSIPSKNVRAFWTDLSNVVHSCMIKVSLDGLRDCGTR